MNTPPNPPGGNGGGWAGNESGTESYLGSQPLHHGIHMRRPRRARLAPLCLGPALLAGLLALGIACREDPPGIRIEFKVENDKFRPDFVKFQWLRPGRLPVEERLPENGDFAASHEVVIGSLFVQTVGPLREARALAASGYRGDKLVSGGLVHIEPSTGTQRLFQLILAEPLPDLDGNGVPDVVDANCFPGSKAAPCTGGPVDAGAPEDARGEGQPDSGPGPAPGGDGGDVDSRPPIEEGLVGFWRFDEGTGAKANDSSGNGNHGSLRGARLAWTEGHLGAALEIPDVANHGVMVPASPSLDGVHAFTIAAWIYRTEDRGASADIVSRRSTGSSEHFAFALTNEGKPRIYLNSHLMPAPPALTGPDPIPMNQWVHLAATYNGTTLHLYANGTDIGNLALSTPIAADKTFLCIGCNQNSDTAVTEPLAGRIDDLRLYQRALNADQIAAIAH